MSEELRPGSTVYTLDDEGNGQGWRIDAGGTPKLDDRVTGTWPAPRARSRPATGKGSWLMLIVGLIAGAAIGIASYGWAVGDQTASSLAIVLVLALAAMLVTRWAVAYYRSGKLVT